MTLEICNEIQTIQCFLLFFGPNYSGAGVKKLKMLEKLQELKLTEAEYGKWNLSRPSTKTGSRYVEDVNLSLNYESSQNAGVRQARC